MRRLQIK